MNESLAAQPSPGRGVPTRSDSFVPRARVTRLLGVASGRPLTIVTGPAGVGKTLAVADWVTNGGPPGTVVWMSLDAGDRDVEQLWRRVVDAIATTVGPTVVDGLTAPLDPDASFLAAVAARSGGLVVVMDDAEKLGGGTALASIDSVLATPPEGFHLVLVSRHDPAMSLHRLRLTDRLAEVRFGDLAFTAPEARALLARAGVNLDDEVIEKVVDATGGWAAPLRLVAHSLRGVDDPSTVLARLDGGYPLVSDYMWDEVVAGLPDDACQVLLRTSVTSRVCGSLARALTDDPDADAVLRSLARDELLVEEVGHAGWFRSHPLLRGVLHARLVAERPELERELRYVAVAWFEQNGDGFEALAQAIETRDWEFAGQVAVRSTAPAVFSSRQPELTALLGELPAVFASVHPEVAA
ncbi:MAG TPA: hypothetical protein VLR88_04755, partial [Propionibacteriaceae bacterium]|nr:hypothetical protein [Propionibacteriaceae bacterium]